MHYYKHQFKLPERPECSIFVQTAEEIAVARHLIPTILKHWSPPKFFYHLRRGGHVSALHRHKHDAYFARLDIENYFPSITRNKIQRALKTTGFSFADSQVIAHRSCVLVAGRRVLPFGYVQSPILASLVLDKSALGQEMREIRKSEIFLSVFMDDIIISHPSEVALVAEACERLEKAATQSGFRLSAEKKQGPAEAITAFNIDIKHEQLKISGVKLEDFSRRILQQGLSKSTEGILGYVRAVNYSQVEQLTQLIHP